MQDANAAVQAHLVGIELLIRKDRLLITHLLLLKKWLCCKCTTLN